MSAAAAASAANKAISKNPFKKLQQFRTEHAFVGKTRTVLIIVMVVAALAIGIAAAFIGRRYGDEKCNCIGVNDSGFRGFSIAILAIGIPLLVIGFIFFGCTTGVADASWGASQEFIPRPSWTPTPT